MATDFTIQDVLEWARTKPAGEFFDFCRSNVCAFAQFGMATGRPELVGPGGSRILYERGWINSFAVAETFGQLVTELEALVQETPAKPSPWLNPQTYVDADVGEYAK